MDNTSFIIDGYRENKVITWITALLLYMLLYPYFVWPFVDSFQWTVLLPLFIIFFINADWKKDILYFVFFVLLTIFICINQHQNIFGSFFVIGCSVLYIAKKGFVFSVYKHFWQIYVIIMTISLLSMILVESGVPLRGVQILPLNDLKSAFYIAYPFYVKEALSTSPRFFGVFDEPGVVGTMSLLLLFIEKFNFKRIGNWILLVSGLLSLSLFFYLALGLLLIIRLFSNNIRTRIRIFLFLLLVGGTVFVISNPITRQYIVERTQWDTDKSSISGDNRASEQLKDHIESIRGTHDYYFGTRSKDIILEYASSASLQNMVLRYGIIVLVLYFVFYVFYAKSYLGFGKKWLFFLALLFMVMYNRPSLLYIPMQFVFNMCIFTLATTLSPKTEA